MKASTRRKTPQSAILISKYIIYYTEIIQLRKINYYKNLLKMKAVISDDEYNIPGKNCTSKSPKNSDRHILKFQEFHSE